MEFVHLTYPTASFEVVTHASQRSLETFVAEDLGASDPETLEAWACEPLVSISDGPWGVMEALVDVVHKSSTIAANNLHGRIGCRFKRVKDRFVAFPLGLLR